jgi:BirA family transcriptional regulator, biotin operon repressor / biotin---[acetyl-CoA-carboxylase] ligase
MRLHHQAVASGVRLVTRDEVGSTNTESLALARAGERGPLWVTARRQSAGRGRRGRVWVSEPGNLYASLLLTDPSPPERAPELSFVAALAVHDAVAALARELSSRLALKWPNDVLIDMKKFSGILIEGEGASAVVGIGINCAQHPGDAIFPATNLGVAGASVTVENLFEDLSGAMTRRLAQWNRGAGFDVIHADWLARAAGLGGPMRVALPEGERAGRFETIDTRGRLILKLADGTTETITAGDVFAFSSEGRAAAAGR